MPPNDSGRWLVMVEVRHVPMAEADPYLLFGLLEKQVIVESGSEALVIDASVDPAVYVRVAR